MEEASPETLTGVSPLRQEQTNKDNTEGNIASTSNPPDKDIILVEADVHDGMEGPTNKKVEVVDLEVSDRETI